MNYRQLGKTGLRVSEIGIGAWQLGGPLKLDGKVDGHPELGKDFCVRLIRDCAELGINFIDTAEQYGNGESERRVGEAIKGARDRWIVGTKFGNQVGPNGERVVNASPERLPVSLEGSLRRLRTDYIDLYVWHVAPKKGEAEQVAELLLKAKERGLVRAIGISTNQIEEARFVQELGCLDVVQFAYSMVSGPDPMLQLLEQSQAGGVLRGAFAGGRLSGRYFQKAPVFHPDDIRSGRVKDPMALAQDYARFARFEPLLRPERGMVQLALRYLLDLSVTSTIIPGGKSLEDYRQAVRACHLPALTAEELGEIRAIAQQINAAA